MEKGLKTGVAHNHYQLKAHQVLTQKMTNADVVASNKQLAPANIVKPEDDEVIGLLNSNSNNKGTQGGAAQPQLTSNDQQIAAAAELTTPSNSRSLASASTKRKPYTTEDITDALQIFSHEKHGDKKMTLEVSRLNNEESFNTVLDILDSNFQTTGGKDFLNSRKLCI